MVFNSNLEKFKTQLVQESYIHLENVLSKKFVDLLDGYGKKILAGKLDEIKEWHIPGKKRQFLFDFPSWEFLDGFRKSLSSLTGQDPKTITISERHIKVYLHEAAQFPAPHMDRNAAQFTIGFPIYIPEESRVCFFPQMSRKENCEQKAIYADVPPNTDMEQFYDDDSIVKFKGGIGDMIIFHGSTIFHERINSAGCLILYIKINSVGQDPLGEHAKMLENLSNRDLKVA